MARVGFAWCDLKPLASWVWRSCTSDRKSGSARGNKKEPRRFCPLSARCGARPLKKLHSDYEAGVSPQTAKSPHDPVPRERACQGESKDSLVQKERRLRIAGYSDPVELGVAIRITGGCSTLNAVRRIWVPHCSTRSKGGGIFLEFVFDLPHSRLAINMAGFSHADHD